MTKHEIFAIEISEDRLMVDWYAQFFFKIGEHPHIMVAGEKMNRNAGIAQFGQLALQTDKSFGDCSAVLKPEIENISQQVNFPGILLNGVKPGTNRSFTFQAGIMVGCAEMKIGSEIYFFAGTHYLAFNKKNVNLLWSVGAQYQCFFDIGSTAWACNKINHGRWGILILLLYQL